jgi:hypothetical protein
MAIDATINAFDQIDSLITEKYQNGNTYIMLGDIMELNLP